MPPSLGSILGPSCLLSMLHVPRCWQFASLLSSSRRSGLKSLVLLSYRVFRHVLNGFDGIIRKSAKVMEVFQNNHNAWFQSRSLSLFWLKTRLSLRWVELPTNDQTTVNIYSALRTTDVAYLSTTPKRQT